MLKRKDENTTVRNASVMKIDHLTGHYLIFLGEGHILEISLNSKSCFRIVESDLMKSYQAKIIGSVNSSLQTNTNIGWMGCCANDLHGII